VEEKFLVNRQDERVNVSRCQKWRDQRCGSRCRCRAHMCRLANLASRVILSVGVGVTECLGDEQHRHDRDGKGKHPNPIASRLVRHTHIDA